MEYNAVHELMTTAYELCNKCTCQNQIHKKIFGEELYFKGNLENILKLLQLGLATLW
jgi:hypothetical protein